MLTKERIEDLRIQLDMDSAIRKELIDELCDMALASLSPDRDAVVEDTQRLDWLLKYAFLRRLGNGASDFDYGPIKTREEIDAAIRALKSSAQGKD